MSKSVEIFVVQAATLPFSPTEYTDFWSPEARDVLLSRPNPPVATANVVNLPSYVNNTTYGTISQAPGVTNILFNQRAYIYYKMFRLTPDATDDAYGKRVATIEKLRPSPWDYDYLSEYGVSISADGGQALIGSPSYEDKGIDQSVVTLNYPDDHYGDGPLYSSIKQLADGMSFIFPVRIWTYVEGHSFGSITQNADLFQGYYVLHYFPPTLTRVSMSINPVEMTQSGEQAKRRNPGAFYTEGARYNKQINGGEITFTLDAEDVLSGVSEPETIRARIISVGIGGEYGYISGLPAFQEMKTMQNNMLQIRGFGGQSFICYFDMEPTGTRDNFTVSNVTPSNISVPVPNNESVDTVTPQCRLVNSLGDATPWCNMSFSGDYPARSGNIGATVGMLDYDEEDAKVNYDVADSFSVNGSTELYVTKIRFYTSDPSVKNITTQFIAGSHNPLYQFEVDTQSQGQKNSFIEKYKGCVVTTKNNYTIDIDSFIQAALSEIKDEAGNYVDESDYGIITSSDWGKHIATEANGELVLVSDTKPDNSNYDAIVSYDQGNTIWGCLMVWACSSDVDSAKEGRGISYVSSNTGSGGARLSVSHAMQSGYPLYIYFEIPPESKRKIGLASICEDHDGHMWSATDMDEGVVIRQVKGKIANAVTHATLSNERYGVIYFSGDTTALYVVTQNRDTRAYTIHTSEDYGRSFSSMPLPFDSSYKTVRGRDMNDGGHCAVGVKEGGAIYFSRSVDGVHWKEPVLVTTIDGVKAADVYQMTLSGSTKLVISDGSTFMIESDDYGKTWGAIDNA